MDARWSGEVKNEVFLTFSPKFLKTKPFNPSKIFSLETAVVIIALIPEGK